MPAGSVGRTLRRARLGRGVRAPAAGRIGRARAGAIVVLCAPHDVEARGVLLERILDGIRAPVVKLNILVQAPAEVAGPKTKAWLNMYTMLVTLSTAQPLMSWLKLAA